MQWLARPRIVAVCLALTLAAFAQPALGADRAGARPADRTVAPRSVGIARPIAIAVDSAGTSYVGYARGGALSRISESGHRRSALTIDQDGPVTGLAVDARDRIWVADDDSLTQLRSDGSVLSRIDRAAPVACPDDSANSSREYGGLAVGPSALYVASRCSAVIEVYDKSSRALLARVQLPGRDRARGLAWGHARTGTAARLFVAVPGSARVLTYNADTLHDGSTPVKRTQITRPGRGKRPTPAGLAVDGAGNLSISDTRNHAIYLYSTAQRYHRYRVLGHPARPSDATGYLDFPAAIAQYPQSSGGLANNLFIADTRNARVQRWDSGGGYTYWATVLRLPIGGDPGDPDDPDDPSPSGVPVNTAPPQITLNAAATTLVCDPGTWSGGSASYGYRWLRDGTTRPGATGSTYSLTAADDGTELVCRVTATTARGSTTLATSPYYVGTPTLPANISRPSITGTPKRDNTLLCTTGSWTGTPAPRFSYVWLRDSVQIADTPSYLVRSADLGTSLTCTVIATNQAGSASASSAAVEPTGVGTGADPTPGPPSDPDHAAPRITRAIVRFADKKWRLQVHAVDDSALGTVQFSSARSNHGRIVAYRASIPVGSPAAARWVRVSDRIGNRSDWFRTS